MTDQELREFVGKIVPAMELGPHGNPYIASFAGGGSGLTFGKFQHDMAHNHEDAAGKNPSARTVFMTIMRAAGLPEKLAKDLADIAARPGVRARDFTPQQLQTINNAFGREEGRRIIDARDDLQRDVVMGYVKQAIEAAKLNPNGPGSFDPSHRDFKKTIGLIASMANRFGPPSKILAFVRGDEVSLNNGHSRVKIPNGEAPSYEGLTGTYFPATLQFAPTELGGRGENLKDWLGRYEQNFQPLNRDKSDREGKSALPGARPTVSRDPLHDQKTRDLMAFATQPEDRVGEILLKRPSSWTEGEVKTVMARPDYWNSPDRGRELVDKTRSWHEQIYGTAPLSHDASGRMIHPQPIRFPNLVPTTPQDASGGTLAQGTQAVVKRVASEAARMGWPQATKLLQSQLNELSLGNRNTNDPGDRIWSNPIPVDGDFGPLTRRKLKEAVASVGSKRLITSLDGNAMS